MRSKNSTLGIVVSPAAQKATGFLDGFRDWKNRVVDAVFGPARGETNHEDLGEAYLFLNPSYCGAEIDPSLWDLLIERPHEPEYEETSNV